MNREEELLQKQLRRLERWWKSLDPEKKAVMERELTGCTPVNLRMMKDGLIEPCEESKTGFKLTDFGELRLHQLRLIECMKK